MASKRKLAQRAKTLARRQSQLKSGGSSAYATKRRRVHAGWDNPGSPIRAGEAHENVVIQTLDAREVLASLQSPIDPERLPKLLKEIAEAPL